MAVRSSSPSTTETSGPNKTRRTAGDAASTGALGSPFGLADLAAAVVLVIAAVLAYALLPDGQPLRVALTVPLVLVVPGYLTIQAFVVREPMARRGMHALLAIGLSPALVGLVALSTSLLPNGFQPALIIGALTAACMILAAVAGYRRVMLGRPVPDAVPAADGDGSSAG